MRGSSVGVIAAERREFRLAVAKHETPRALLMTGAVFVVMVALNWALGLSTARDRVIDLLIVALLAGCWALIRRPSVPSSLSPWAFAAFATSVVLGMVAQIWVTPTGPGFTYVLCTVIAAGPLTLAWRPMIVAAVPMTSACLALATRFPSPTRENWMLVSVAALALGLVLMQIRLQGIDALGRSQAQVRATATRDRLTGVLNRLGVEDRLSEIAGIAARHGEQVFIAFVDVDGLKQANDQHGHEFGDAVLRAVANALRACVRVGDLVGRWGGDEFIVLGVGHPDDPDQLAERITAHVLADGPDLSRWTGGVSVGTATAFTNERAFEDLLRDADEDMYARRRHRRGR